MCDCDFCSGDKWENDLYPPVPIRCTRACPDGTHPVVLFCGWMGHQRVFATESRHIVGLDALATYTSTMLNTPIAGSDDFWVARDMYDGLVGLHMLPPFADGAPPRVTGVSARSSVCSERVSRRKGRTLAPTTEPEASSDTVGTAMEEAKYVKFKNKLMKSTPASQWNSEFVAWCLEDGCVLPELVSSRRITSRPYHRQCSFKHPTPRGTLVTVEVSAAALYSRSQYRAIVERGDMEEEVESLLHE